MSEKFAPLSRDELLADIITISEDEDTKQLRREMEKAEKAAALREAAEKKRSPKRKPLYRSRESKRLLLMKNQKLPVPKPVAKSRRVLLPKKMYRKPSLLWRLMLGPRSFCPRSHRLLF